MFCQKLAALLLTLCLMAPLLPAIAKTDKCDCIKHLDSCHKNGEEPVKVLFSYLPPKNFDRENTLFLYFVIVNLANGENSKMIVKKISRPHQRKKIAVRLKPRELVFAFIFSENQPFTTFNPAEAGFLRVTVNGQFHFRLKFTEYDANTGATLFDLFHLEKLDL